jgi:ATP-dependent Lhr-like helicase
LSYDLARDIGKFRKLMMGKLNAKKTREEILEFINEYLCVDENAANAIYEYFAEQYNYVKQFGTDKILLVEHYTAGEDSKVVFHSMFGRRVNDCLSRAVAFAIARTEHKNVEVGINDNGFYIGAGKKINVMKAFKLLKSEKLDLVLNMAIENSEVFKRRFRHCATRALMILRNYLGRQKRVGRQQVSSMILMSALKRINPEFSILKEARREVLEDLMDIGHTKEVLKEIEDGKIKVVEITTNIPSPFAFNTALQGYMDVMKIEDKIEFLKRMHQLVLAKISLNK